MKQDERTKYKHAHQIQNVEGFSAMIKKQRRQNQLDILYHVSLTLVALAGIGLFFVWASPLVIRLIECAKVAHGG